MLDHIHYSACTFECEYFFIKTVYNSSAKNFSARNDMMPHMDMTDEQLAEQSAHGDDDAFQEIVHRYLKPIYRFVFQYAHTDDDTEDIVQDTFLKAWKHIKRYKKGRPFKPWIFTIARNTALDALKKKRPSSFSSLSDGNDDVQFEDTLQDTELLPDELFERAEITEELSEILSNLHPDHQSVLTLYYHEGLTFEEISQTIDRPMNTVKSWHRRALIRIRDHMHQKAH